MSCPPKDIIMFCGHFCSYFFTLAGPFICSIKSSLSLLGVRIAEMISKILVALQYYFKYQRVMFCCCSPLFLQLKTLSKVNSNGPLSFLKIFKRPAVGN